MSIDGHDARFPAPIWTAYRVGEHPWKGAVIREGQAINFRTPVWDGLDRREVRVEGTIAELWLEPWHGVELLYAEVDLAGGATARAWFDRDGVAEASGLVGDVIEGALW